MEAQISSRIGTRSTNRWKVVSLFGAMGALNAGIVLISFQLGLGAVIFVGIGVPFATVLLLSVWAVSNQGWLSLPRNSPTGRAWAAGLLFAISQPVALLLALAISFLLTPRELLDFDVHPVESLSRLELGRYRSAWPVGGFFAVVIVFLLCVVAVRVLTGKWPKHSWSWALRASLLMSIALSIPILIGSERLLLVVWYSLLGTVIGYWIYETLTKTVEA